MAVKIFCNSCQEYIRDATRGELAELRGTEICVPCSEKSSQALAEVDKIRKKTIHKISVVADKGLADIEDVMRRIIKGEADE